MFENTMLQLSFVLVLAGCGGGSDSNPDCDKARSEIETECAKDGLSDIQKKTCETAKKSVGTMAEMGRKTGKTEIAADGCRKQAEGIRKMTARASAKPAVKTASAGPAAVAKAGSDACDKVSKEIEAACGNPGALSATGKAICKATSKLAENMAKIAKSNADAAEEGCKKTAADWKKKGGLKKMVSK